MEETLYFKKALPEYNDLVHLIRHYMELGSPATFSSSNNQPQCSSSRNRSVDDWLMIANHYFPGVTMTQLIKAMIEFNAILAKEDKSIILFVCSTIRKPVILQKILDTRMYFNENKEVHGLFHKNFIERDCTGSKWTMTKLIKLITPIPEEV